MDSDFHYYGTGTAALAAGFSEEESTLIANVAQYHDWFHSDYWSNWYLVDKEGAAVKDPGGSQYHYVYPQLTAQKLDWKMVVDYDASVWTPFHFPPGNVASPADSKNSQGKDGWKNTFASHHQVRKTGLGPDDSCQLCRPYSQFAMDMLADTIEQFNQLSNATGSDLEQKTATLLGDRKRCPVSDGKQLALYLLGIRLHVLSDTWAHQDFTGADSAAVNGAGIENNVYAKNAQGEYKLTQWVGTLDLLHADTDCSAAPNKGSNPGHGQLGHLPDYSWITMKYPASWLPAGQEYHERENPTQYVEAWSWVSQAMKLCRGALSDAQIKSEPEPTPDELSRTLSTFHVLSTTASTVIPASEKLWQQTALGKKLPERWSPENRKALGLYNGLAVTREGYINVVKDSTLHCMETAAAIHYQFCVEWAKKNQAAYPSWKLATPKT